MLVTTCTFSFPESCQSSFIHFSFQSRVSHHLYIFLSRVLSAIIYTFSFPESCQSLFIHFPFRSRVGHHVFFFRVVSVTTCTFSFPEPCRSPHPHRAVQLPVGHHRHPGHQRVAAGRADGGDATCGSAGGRDAGLEGRTVPPGLLHRHPHTHPRLRPAAVDGWASHLFFFLLRITVVQSDKNAMQRPLRNFGLPKIFFAVIWAT